MYGQIDKARTLSPSRFTAHEILILHHSSVRVTHALHQQCPRDLQRPYDSTDTR